jgi:hypothetical protein
MPVENIVILIIVYVVINFIILFNEDIETMESNYNPIQVYKDNNVNWFGCILLVLVTHIIFIIPAIVYWFYKLCTVGRR